MNVEVGSLEREMSVSIYSEYLAHNCSDGSERPDDYVLENPYLYPLHKLSVLHAREEAKRKHELHLLVVQNLLFELLVATHILHAQGEELVDDVALVEISQDCQVKLSLYKVEGDARVDAVYGHHH